jgi:NAD(P)-dependent dehydrogenase (short-subunit alcohol dehydrogenase family)
MSVPAQTESGAAVLGARWAMVGLVFLDTAEKACGATHILVNNAGCNIRKPAIDVSWDDWNTVLDTNLRNISPARRCSWMAASPPVQPKRQFRHDPDKELVNYEPDVTT